MVLPFSLQTFFKESDPSKNSVAMAIEFTWLIYLILGGEKNLDFIRKAQGLPALVCTLYLLCPYENHPNDLAPVPYLLHGVIW